MRYFVTGATGFIGRRLVSKLLASPDNMVWFLLRDSSRARLPELLAGWGADGARAVAVSGDILKDGLGLDDAVRTALAGTVDHFFHLAAVYDLRAGLPEQMAATVETYLPTSDDPILGAVLQMLEADPGDTRTLAELARAAHTTERTLMRRCQRDLGMSFSAWRQRLRVVRAIARLDTGQTVERIALDLGYGSASAFITMFRRMTGMTPDEFRKHGVRRGT